MQTLKNNVSGYVENEQDSVGCVEARVRMTIFPKKGLADFHNIV